MVDSKLGEVCWDGSRIFLRFLGGIGGWNFRRIGGWYIGPAGRCFVRLLGGGVAWRGRRISGWHRSGISLALAAASDLSFQFESDRNVR